MYTFIILFSPSISLLYRWRNWSVYMLYNVSKVTQLKSCGESQFYRFKRDESDNYWMNFEWKLNECIKSLYVFWSLLSVVLVQLYNTYMVPSSILGTLILSHLNLKIPLGGWYYPNQYFDSMTLRHREIKWFPEHHQTRKHPSWDLNIGRLILASLLFFRLQILLLWFVLIITDVCI